MFSPVAFTASLCLSLLLTLVKGSANAGPHDIVQRQNTVGPYDGTSSVTPLGYWPFVDTLYDVSTNALGPVLINGTGVQLVSSGNTGYIQIRKPGFLSIPAVNIRTIDFGIEFSLRIPSVPTSKQVLLSNWELNEWQYLMTLDIGGFVTFTLRRNIFTLGNSPTQDLVAVTTAAPIPVGGFSHIVYVYDTTRRLLSVHINGTLSASATVPALYTDLTLHNATQTYVQFGYKADDFPVTGELNADLSQLRFVELVF